MNRRDFFKRSALVAAGAVAADQLEIIERLGWRRKLFALGGLDYADWGVTSCGIHLGPGVATLKLADDTLVSFYSADFQFLPLRAKGMIPSRTTSRVGLFVSDYFTPTSPFKVFKMVNA